MFRDSGLGLTTIPTPPISLALAFSSPQRETTLRFLQETRFLTSPTAPKRPYNWENTRRHAYAPS